MPDKDRTVEELQSLMETNCVTERAIKVMLYIMRSQLFSDGNKRVAQLAANQILIQNGKGFLRIPVERNKEFFQLLVSFYETNEDSKILNFIYNTSIFGKRTVEMAEQEPINESMFKKHHGKSR